MFNMNSKNNIRDRFDELFERYEVIYGKRLSQKELAEILCCDEGSVSKKLSGKVKLYDEEILKLSDIFKVSTDVILGKETISEMKSKNNVELKDLSECSKQWIIDNSQSKRNKSRVEMLNILLSHPQIADLFFDTLTTYSLGLPISTSPCHETVSRDQAEQQLLKGIVLSRLDEVYKCIFKYTQNTREHLIDKKVTAITNRFRASYKKCKQIRLEKEEEELKYVLEELKSGKEDMDNDNIHLSVS